MRCVQIIAVCLWDNFSFDHLRCAHCYDFLRSRFQGVTEYKLLKSVVAELERHISKLRRYCHGIEPRITLNLLSSRMILGKQLGRKS